jgi:hypothetical protein
VRGPGKSSGAFAFALFFLLLFLTREKGDQKKEEGCFLQQPS